LQLRPDQINAFRASAVDVFVATLKSHVREHFPMHWRLSGEAAVERTIRGLNARARDAHGIDTRRGVMLYVTVAMMLGSGFDRDPMVPWVAAELEGGPRPDAGLADARMDTLADLALAYQKRVSGEDNRALYRALFVLDADLDRFVAPLVTGLHPEAEILRRLEEAHPVKAEYLGTHTLRVLISRSSAVAARIGLTDFPGRALLALLHFMLGAHAHADPMLPWISQALNGAPDASQRLQTRAAAFLADILSKAPRTNV
jgi:hypothetical protein